MTKEESIQEAYGEYWDLVKNHIDENGWCGKRKKIKFEELKKSFDIQYDLFNFYWFRPKSLDGIDNNNDWIKIESDSDLPKENIECYVTKNIGHIELAEFDFENQRFYVDNRKMSPTHYQKIIKPKHPIY